MSAEFILSFPDGEWYSKNKELVGGKITELETFTIKNGIEFQLAGYEIERGPKDWDFDVRLFLREIDIFIEISAHPLSIENDLSFLFEWIRKQTKIFILDDDGEDSGW